MGKTFSFDKERIINWSNDISNYLNGSTDSIQSCSLKFSEQLQKLVQPGVWTGAAASKNYMTFVDTHDRFVALINSFGNTYEEQMKKIISRVSEIDEISVDGTLLKIFGPLNFEQLKTLSSQNINKSIIEYDYDALDSINTTLNSIYGDLLFIKKELTIRLEQLNDGSSLWDGQAAEVAKNELLTVLNFNMDKVVESLYLCMDNIGQAMDNAKAINM
jgi:uncharacterized protein YukE